MIDEPAGLVAEEDRSRRPTVFSAIREVMDAFAGTDPHLGLYGAFGYDLAWRPTFLLYSAERGNLDNQMHEIGAAEADRIQARIRDRG